MNNVSPFKSPEAVPHDADLETLLVFLSRYGSPKVSLITGEWYASITMNTNQEGAEFKVASDFRHSRPTAAVQQLFERTTKALEALGTGIGRLPK